MGHNVILGKQLQKRNLISLKMIRNRAESVASTVITRLEKELNDEKVSRAKLEGDLKELREVVKNLNTKQGD